MDDITDLVEDAEYEYWRRKEQEPRTDDGMPTAGSTWLLAAGLVTALIGVVVLLLMARH